METIGRPRGFLLRTKANEAARNETKCSNPKGPLITREDGAKDGCVRTFDFWFLACILIHPLGFRPDPVYTSILAAQIPLKICTGQDAHETHHPILPTRSG